MEPILLVHGDWAHISNFVAIYCIFGLVSSLSIKVFTSPDDHFRVNSLIIGAAPRK